MFYWLSIRKNMCQNILSSLLYLYPENLSVNLSVLWMSNKLKFDQCLTLPTRYLVKSETLSLKIKHVSQFNACLKCFIQVFIIVHWYKWWNFFWTVGLFYLQAVFWLTRAALTRLETCSPRFVRPQLTSVMSGSTLPISMWSRSNTSPQYKW